jgi:uncharacterized repeat protein (TIGR03803 family)
VNAFCDGSAEMEEFMKCNMGLRRIGEILLAIIIVVPVLAPGVRAASKYKSLHAFKGGADGAAPYAGLILDSAGNLYGTTANGGSANCSLGCGVVFKLQRDSHGGWSEKVLHTFCVTSCNDGAVPSGGLIFDTAGNLYGTTYGGGAQGSGTVFQLKAHSDGSWTESVLYSFCSLSNCADGRSPQAGLIFDSIGNLYGTTVNGGSDAVGGTVFKLTSSSNGSWTESVLHSFVSTEGTNPTDSLVFDSAGNLYGTTSADSAAGGGTVFQLIPQTDGSWKESVLHQFIGKDGFRPYAGLTVDQAGNLYGTTPGGGDLSRCSSPYVGCGVVFKLTPNGNGSWKEILLHTFRGGPDGASPFAGLIFDQSGNLYGTTAAGGNLRCNRPFAGCGLVFKLAPNSTGRWRETVMQTFDDHPGDAPIDGLIFDTAGNLYGTTYGQNGYTTNGSVFEITP